jgi:hypothetical protein
MSKKLLQLDSRIRFSMSVKEFEWHIKELEKLDGARKADSMNDLFELGWGMRYGGEMWLFH